MCLDRYGARLIPSKGYSAVEGARYIFRTFLRGEGTHLLMLDDDAVLAPETLTRLLARDLPIVGALTWTGGLPPMPTLYRGFQGVHEGKHPSWLIREDDLRKFLLTPQVQAELTERQAESGLVLRYDGDNALSRCDAVGFHCLLIRRDVLETIGEPFLEGNAAGVREDFDFSERVIRAGFDLFVDKTVIAGHVIGHAIRPVDYYAYALVRQTQAEDAKALEETR